MAASIGRSAILFGKIITSDLTHAVKVGVPKYVMDERLNMYFKEQTQYYAYDKTKECKEGDYVIIKEYPESPEKKVTHTVEKVVYKLGHLIDPVTGKRTSGTEYIEDIQRLSELFGRKVPYEYEGKGES
ncbi:28S ribosomal protein S17, mitochondrial-like [Uloborus diversus]|uniref:28S ribosomal protein S17, mitochondrial-like n=1 Tax=Uloborus diversus TaxID=327109 RepID=UPI002409B03F|nr:28S ribosomal protein S17, mitochondrial-like [Uloborus diversus]